VETSSLCRDMFRSLVRISIQGGLVPCVHAVLCIGASRGCFLQAITFIRFCGRYCVTRYESD
jgi:hypothetical protein